MQSTLQMNKASQLWIKLNNKNKTKANDYQSVKEEHGWFNQDQIKTDCFELNLQLIAFR